MARKKTIEDLRMEREKAEQDLKVRQQNLKKLKQKEAELTRRERTHRLCTHGAMLEKHLDPEEFTDEQIDYFLNVLFRKRETLELLDYVKRKYAGRDE